jgi:hypothetical protein
MKPYTKIAAVFFGLGVILHLIRLFYPFRIMIGRNMIPYSASFIAIPIALVLCIGLWREARNKS